MDSRDIRSKFLDFFAARDHVVKPSTPIIPRGDASLMFNSAGMVPFKPYFLGIKKDLSRATSSQKCFRTTDIDRVGHTLRHLTFFEMLGNFSFGDYFKKEAIAWSWEFLTKEMGFDPKRLHPSVFKDDPEALELWKKLGVPNAPVKLGEEDNYWNMGPTGPCGPCSEIYFDRGAKHSCGKKDCAVGCDCDRYIEIWNLVFTQFDRQKDGSLKPLPRTNIDTGMGLERLVFTANDRDSLYDTDQFSSVVEKTAAILGVDPKRDKETELAFRVIADHSRAAVMLSSEGVLPSNVERGYVLRRLIRRAVRYGQLLGHDQPFLHKLVGPAVDIFAKAYPEIKAATAQVASTIKIEEEKFLETLANGEVELKTLLEKTNKTLPGAQAFHLYETFGFPLELTKEICEKQGITVDEKGFEAASEKAANIARGSWKGSGEKLADSLILPADEKDLEFSGYDFLEEKTRVMACQTTGDKTAVLVLKKTPFYPEGGGQVGDKGTLFAEDGKTPLAKVTDTQKQGTVHVHTVEFLGKNVINVDDTVVAKVDNTERNRTAPHHTATHLLNEALRRILGDHVRQAGSLVNDKKLRFDFTHPKPLGPDLIKEIETMVTAEIAKALPVSCKTHPASRIEEFKPLTLLGEDYGEKPRFVLIGAKGWEDPMKRFSLELCGGTHVANTSEIERFKIVHESSAAAGIRRIEAIAGASLEDYELSKKKDEEQTIAHLLASHRILLEDISALGGKTDELPTPQRKIPQLRVREKELKELLTRLKTQKAAAAGEATRTVIEVKGLKLCAQRLEGADPKSLRGLADSMKSELGSGVVFIAASQKDKISFVLSATKDIAGKGFDAGKVAKKFAAAAGGSAGGRPDFAQGGVKNADWDSLLKSLTGLF